jgi:hypothetical protein
LPTKRFGTYKHGRPTDLKTALRQSAGLNPVAESSKKWRRIDVQNEAKSCIIRASITTGCRSELASTSKAR